MECTYTNTFWVEKFTSVEYSSSWSESISNFIIKSANVFLSKDGHAKLGDLNVSKVAKNGLLYTQTGTPYYASP